MASIVLVGFFLSVCVLGHDTNTHEDPEYLLVGAGGGSLQMALYLEKFGRTYTILERNAEVGSFWSKFPRFDELISVNKHTRNATEQYRYDWHSFLEAPIRMMDLSDDYFPKGRDWQTYMALVAEKAGILPNVEFNTHVKSIATDGTPCVILEDNTKRCAKRRVFVGTGLKEKDEPLLRAIGGIPYSQVTRDMARRRRVCIVGNGNSGFEIAQNVYGVADRVTIYGKYPHRLSSVTRYTGDVRIKYLQVLENMNGKLLDTVEYFEPVPRIKGAEKILNKNQLDILKSVTRTASWLDQFDCETFFIATGFETNVPGGVTLDSRFPPTNDWYQSTDNPSVHFIGWMMHERDFRRGASGFLSGYRYLIRNLANRIEEEDHGIPYPYDSLTKQQVVVKAVARFQEAHDLIILQDGVVIKDMVVPVLGETDKYHYYEGITYEFHKQLGRDDIISLYFAWGDGRRVENVFDGVIRYSDTKSLINFFLHPVVQVGSMTRDIHEDLEMAWKDPAYIAAIKKTIQNALDGDLSLFRPKPAFPYVRSTINQTESGYYEMAPLKAGIDNNVFQSIIKAILTGNNKQQIDELTMAMKQWQPALFDSVVHNVESCSPDCESNA